MRTPMSAQLLPSLLLVSALLPAAFAQINVPGTGVDGALDLSSCTGEYLIDLGNAETGSWDQGTRVVAGNGVYDADKWAVVFDYTSVTIGGDCVVKFTNHPKNPPVVWLVQGDVSVDGTIDLQGETQTGTEYRIAIPGPGGFRGAKPREGGLFGGSGFGPGGGGFVNGNGAGAAGYANDGGGVVPGIAYGNPRVLPLIGGSGGASRGSDVAYGGGAGAGAILIAADGTITVDGVVRANGGSGGGNSGSGSGGAIRLVADLVDGLGWLRTIGSTAGTDSSDGFIRIEANTINLSVATDPEYTYKSPLDGGDPVLWLSDLPTERRKARVEIVSIDGQDVSGLDPEASVAYGQADLNLNDPTLDPITIEISATDVPTPTEGNPWTVLVRATFPTGGSHVEATATFVSGNIDSSTWEASMALNNGMGVLQVRAYKP